MCLIFYFFFYLFFIYFFYKLFYITEMCICENVHLFFGYMAKDSDTCRIRGHNNG